MDNKKINVAFYVGSLKKAGGGFQYEYKAVQLINQFKSEKINIKIMSDIRSVISDYKNSGMEIIFMKYRQYDNSLITFEDFMKIQKIDLVYFLMPTKKANDLKEIPYITTVWDLCHRDYNEFPEVRNNGEFERREEIYSSILKKAIKITTDSLLGKKNICYRYGINENRVEILKFLPRDTSTKKHINIKKSFNISNNYIFYPAQFWAHKNHIYILKALKILKEKREIFIDAIFTGADYGNLEYILEKAKEYNIHDQIHYLGFVEDEIIPSLYKQSLALVMPTYFGPTNIPPLEAFKLRVPVCYSNLEGLKEQVNDAAFLMDLSNPNSLVEHLQTIINNPSIVKEKKEKGLKILDSWKEEDFINTIFKMINEYKTIRECWK